MAKLSDKQRKQIIAEYVAGGTSQRKLADKYGVSQQVIKTILKKETELTQKISDKKAENTVSILAFMDTQKDSVCDIIEKLLAAMNNPAKIAATSLPQLATTMGIVIDKFTANETVKSSDVKENNLFEAMEAWKEDDFSDLPEIQQTTDRDASVVENGSTQE